MPSACSQRRPRVAAAAAVGLLLVGCGSTDSVGSTRDTASANQTVPTTSVLTGTQVDTSSTPVPTSAVAATTSVLSGTQVDTSSTPVSTSAVAATTVDSTIQPSVTPPLPVTPTASELDALFESCRSKVQLPQPPVGLPPFAKDFSPASVNPFLVSSLMSVRDGSGLALYLLPADASLLLAAPSEHVLSGVTVIVGSLEDSVVGAERRGGPADCDLIAAEGWGRVTADELIAFTAGIKLL